MEKQLTCPRCSGNMETGLIVDYTYGAQMQSRWAEGQPEKSRWYGLKLRGKVTHPVTTFRCEKCGYLESYANDD